MKRSLFIVIALALAWWSLVPGDTPALAQIGGGPCGVLPTPPCNVTSTPTPPSSSPTVGIAPGVAGSAVSSLVLKASGGNLYNIYVTAGATAGWLMVFNATALPANGATTAGNAAGNMQDCIAVPANTTQSITYNPGPPEVFSTGITAAFSSTACGTLTASATAFIHGSGA